MSQKNVSNPNLLHFYDKIDFLFVLVSTCRSYEGGAVEQDFKKYIRDIPNFPIPGVLFRDVSPLLANPAAFSSAIEGFGAMLDLNNVDAFVGVESRGFIFASALALRFQKSFIPVRKAGKLPPPTRQMSYKLEYGEAKIEMSPGQGRVVVLDDVLATGGTLEASKNLCEQSGYEVVDLAVLINLTFLNQMKFRNQRVKSLVRY